MRDNSAPATSAAVLAGGTSSRLGFPKAHLRLGTGRTLLEDTVRKLKRLSDDTFVVANDSLFDVPGTRRESDRWVGAAALGGIHAALIAARHDRVIVTGCDMPFLSVPLLKRLIDLDPDADVVVPRIDGYPEPLHAIYRRACLPAIEEQIRAKKLRIIGFYPSVRVRFVDEPELREIDPLLRSFRNCNTPDLVRHAALDVARDGIESLIR